MPRLQCHLLCLLDWPDFLVSIACIYRLDCIVNISSIDWIYWLRITYHKYRTVNIAGSFDTSENLACFLINAKKCRGSGSGRLLGPFANQVQAIKLACSLLNVLSAFELGRLASMFH